MAERVAGVHADMVNQHIKKLNCPSEQKVQLLDAVIRAASKEKAGEQTPYSLNTCFFLYLYDVFEIFLPRILKHSFLITFPATERSRIKF